MEARVDVKAKRESKADLVVVCVVPPSPTVYSILLREQDERDGGRPAL